MLKIYGVPISVHTRKVIVAARIKGLPFELVPVVPVIPGNPPPHWRQLSPTGKIPVLQDGDFTLPDSAAICAYLEHLHPQPPLYPSDARAYAQALWLEQYIGFALERARYPKLAALFDRVIRHRAFVDALQAEQPVVQQMALKSDFLNAVLA